jgi:hypothetical protein
MCVCVYVSLSLSLSLSLCAWYVHIHPSSTQHSLSFAAILQVDDIEITSTIPAADDIASSCHLDFLASEQQHAKPAGTFKHDDGWILSGKLPLRLVATHQPQATTSTTTSATTVASSTLEPLPSSATLGVVLDHCSAAMCKRPRTQSLHNATQHDSVDPIPRTNLLLDKQSFRKMSITEFVQMKDLGEIVKPTVEPLLKDLTPTVTGVMGSTMTFALSSGLGETVEAGLGDLIPMELARKVAAPIQRQLVPTVTEMVTDEVPAAVADNIKTYLDYELTPRITEHLTKRLDHTVVKKMEDAINEAVPPELDEIIIKELGHMLTRSLTHSIVPSVLHTLTHSPMSDYFCYYCFHQDEYCDYCTYSPSQYYNSMFYSGYYTSWYSHYYSNYFGDILVVERSDEGQKAEERYKEQQLGQGINGQQRDLVIRPVVNV